MLAVCLTGQLRWFELTLASLRHFVLSQLSGPRRLFFVGPMGERSTFGAAEKALAELGAAPLDICAYHPRLTWAWGPGALGYPNGPFEMHGSDVCTRRLPPSSRRIAFDMRWLPVFRRCIVSKKGSEDKVPQPSNMNDDDKGGGECRACDKYNFSRATPCSSATSLIIQLWQSSQSLALVRAAERRGAPLHDAILRMRPDIFFFRPVRLPRPPAGETTWYSMLEDSCMVHEGVFESTYGLKHRRFLQDFWLYGSRSAMDVAMAEPLQRLLEFGRDASAFQACAVCHERPRSITLPGKRLEMCCQRSRKSLRSTPKYAMHPVPEVLNRSFSRAQCVTFHDYYGLLRVNTAASCFMVQARLPIRLSMKRVVEEHKALNWRQVDLSTVISRRSDSEAARQLRQGVVSLYHRCFGLTANRSCPRTVGDRKLFSGPEASCLRSTTARCGPTDLIPTAGGQSASGCLQSGLSKLLAAWTTADEQPAMGPLAGR